MVMIVCSFELCVCTKSAVNSFFFSLFQRSESLFSCDKLCCACYMSITVDLCYNCENYLAVITPDRNFADIRTTESC